MTALIFTGLFAAAALLGALFVMLTARDDGSFGWPRWPARYPARPGRGIYGDVCARLVALVIAVAVLLGPVTEEEWDAQCRRTWEPSEEEQVRT